jgi:hypothetical protein
MGRVLAILIAAILLFAGAVWYSQRRPPPPQSYSGLEFAAVSAADAARTPAPAKGAAILAVDPDSPADKAGITAGEVVVAIDGIAINSARQAADAMRRYRAGQRAAMTLYDIAAGNVMPVRAVVTLAAMPDPKLTGAWSVRPPRTLAKEALTMPPILANAAWARRRLSRGAFIRPQPLYGLGAGRCNALAPERWRVAGAAPDGSLFHVMAPSSFQHAVFLDAPLAGGPAAFVTAKLQELFASPARLSPPRSQPFGFVLRNFGNARGGAGFAEYRVRNGHIQLWIAAVAAGEAGWALPITGAVAFSMNCGPAMTPRDPALAATAVSAQCLGGKCQDSDFAAAYLKTLRLGYVHDPKGRNYLVDPRRDLWASGAQGPGYYHQVSGENEKLEPGRTN